jgi:xanthine dehydrogenase accessory factor
MKKLMKEVCTLLAEGEDLVLVTVCCKTGSAPRMAGARMIVRRDGRIAGTIGGGLMEALAIQDARKAFSHKQSLSKKFDLTNADAAITDMICGGNMEIYMEYIPADAGNLALFTTLLAALNRGRRLTLVSRISAKGPADRPFLMDDKGLLSEGPVPETLLAAVKKIRSSTSSPTVICHDTAEYLVSYFSIAGELFLIGAGHVSACTAEAAARVGFRVIVLDDRKEFANPERFPTSDEVRVIPFFADCFKDYDVNQDSYLVIVTRGHIHDYEVLRQALATKAGYVGMIGSRKKRDTIYNSLLANGISQPQLDRVHSPIGLPIEADTPEEIAVSIVAELIQQRALGRNRG